MKESCTSKRSVISFLYREDWKYGGIRNECSTLESKGSEVSILEENSVSENRGRCGQDRYN